MNKEISGTGWIVALLVALLCVVAMAALISYSAYVPAAEAQDIVQRRGDQILDMIGPAGIFAILGSIVMVRAIRMLGYCTKQMSFLITLAVSAIIGAGSAWAGAGADTAREIIAGAFLCAIGTPLTFELVKWVVALAYQQTKWPIWKVLYFTLSPRPIVTSASSSTEDTGDGSLTKFFDDKTEPKP